MLIMFTTTITTIILLIIISIIRVLVDPPNHVEHHGADDEAVEDVPSPVGPYEEELPLLKEAMNQLEAEDHSEGDSDTAYIQHIPGVRGICS